MTNILRAIAAIDLAGVISRTILTESGPRPGHRSLTVSNGVLRSLCAHLFYVRSIMPIWRIQVWRLEDILREQRIDRVDSMKSVSRAASMRLVSRLREVFRQQRVEVLGMALHPDLLASRGRTPPTSLRSWRTVGTECRGLRVTQRGQAIRVCLAAPSGLHVPLHANSARHRTASDRPVVSGSAGIRIRYMSCPLGRGGWTRGIWRSRRRRSTSLRAARNLALSTGGPS
jgi:hypothetical protein